MNFVKRRGSTAYKNDKIENFDQLKEEYLDRIEKTVSDYEILSSLIINWDHAGLKIIPVSNWTMATEGSKRVEISGLGINAKLLQFLPVHFQVRFVNLSHGFPIVIKCY